MTIDRQKGNVVFECDACNETLETKTSNFSAAMDLLRHEGWKARKEDEEWVHYCDKCIGA